MIRRPDAQAAVDGLLTSARHSAAATLTLVGTAGIGKTVLCQYAVDQALEAGFSVIQAVGVQWESGFELGAMTQIMRPLQAWFKELAPVQRDQLLTVVNGAPAALPDPFQLAAAALACVVRAAEDRPLLIVVDDVHWIDRSSVAVLVFIVRRLVADAIAVLFAHRDGERELLPATWPRHAISPLTADEVRMLIASSRPDLPGLPMSVAATVQRRAAGNTLAVCELAPHLTAAHTSLSLPIPDPLPLGPRGQVNFADRIGALPAETRSALAVIAALGSQSSLVPAALNHLDIPLSAVDAAVDSGVLMDMTSWRFTHPLCRSAAYAAAPTAQRRIIHRTLAELNRLDELERFAWHLDAAGADAATVAEAYQSAAQAITHRAGDAAAGGAWTRAAELSAVGPLRRRRALQAATSLFLMGDHSACERWLDEVLATAASDRSESEVLAAALLLRCQSAVWHVTEPAQLHSLVESTEPLAALDPKRMIIALGTLSAGFENHGKLATGSELTDRAVVMAESRPEVERLIAACWKSHIDTLHKGGKSATPVEQILPLARVAEFADAMPVHMWTVPQTAQWQENLDYASRACDVVIARLRETRNLSWLPYALAVDAETRWWMGNWNHARAAASEALDLAEEAGQDAFLGYAKANVGLIEAVTGHDDVHCRAVLEGALAHCDRVGLQPIALYAEHSYGLFELGRGHAAAAAAHLARAHATAVELDAVQPVVAYHADYIEALIRGGDFDSAHDILGYLDRIARRSGSRWAAGVSMRCRGLLTVDPDTAADLLKASINHFTRKIPLPFERHRGELELGMYLRRRRELASARLQLRTAATGFAALGSTPWLQRAENELRAAGDRFPPRSAAGKLHALSPQQLQVVLAVVGGATNRQAATEMFISPKTVDYHLRRAYAILGVHTRMELSQLVNKML